MDLAGFEYWLPNFSLASGQCFDGAVIVDALVADLHFEDSHSDFAILALAPQYSHLECNPSAVFAEVSHTAVLLVMDYLLVYSAEIEEVPPDAAPATAVLVDGELEAEEQAVNEAVG